MVFGTSSVELSWTAGDDLRGEPDNELFYVRFQEGMAKAFTVPTAILNGTIGITPGSDQELQVSFITGTLRVVHDTIMIVLRFVWYRKLPPD